MSAVDTFKTPETEWSPACNSASVTPSDESELAFLTRGLYVGVSGNVSVKLRDDSTAVVFVGVAEGTILPLQVKQVMATNTTSTNIIALW
tara:strand:+ start:2937 stop:3206 length:270 start_codon:yes stop_codon:yes gene_type:complete